jgi:NADH-quinone oxidoreductase subunit L
MAVVLIVLAIGSVLAGYVGLPGVLGGRDRLAAFLAPSFTVVERPADAVEHIQEPNEAREHEAEEATRGLELTLMAASTVTALLGISIAAALFLRYPWAADDLVRKFPGIYRLLSNKYYVDEMYDATIVQPIKIVSEEGLWKGVDVRLIDGTVNGVADSVGGASEVLRRLQTGSVRAYAASLLVGVVAILGYYLWP